MREAPNSIPGGRLQVGGGLYSANGSRFKNHGAIRRRICCLLDVVCLRNEESSIANVGPWESCDVDCDSRPVLHLGSIGRFWIVAQGGGIRSRVVPYAIAKRTHDATERGRFVDLEGVWRAQALRDTAAARG